LQGFFCWPQAFHLAKKAAWPNLGAQGVPENAETPIIEAGVISGVFAEHRHIFARLRPRAFIPKPASNTRR
ncbi:MAG: hypothetical protein RSB98_07725, partial [Raoultibacter sp.]